MVPAIRALIAPAVMSRFLEGAMEAGERERKYERLMLRLLIFLLAILIPACAPCTDIITPLKDDKYISLCMPIPVDF